MKKEKTSMFSKAAAESIQEMAETAATLMKPEEEKNEKTPREAARKREDTVRISLTMSAFDKEWIKSYAFKKGVSVSDLLHQWISETYLKETGSIPAQNTGHHIRYSVKPGKRLGRRPIRKK